MRKSKSNVAAVSIPEKTGCPHCGKKLILNGWHQSTTVFKEPAHWKKSSQEHADRWMRSPRSGAASKNLQISGLSFFSQTKSMSASAHGKKSFFKNGVDSDLWEREKIWIQGSSTFCCPCWKTFVLSERKLKNFFNEF